jgi:hypothetical protein
VSSKIFKKHQLFYANTAGIALTLRYREDTKKACYENGLKYSEPTDEIYGHNKHMLLAQYKMEAIHQKELGKSLKDTNFTKAQEHFKTAEEYCNEMLKLASKHPVEV